jgi:hypothetical protein
MATAEDVTCPDGSNFLITGSCGSDSMVEAHSVAKNAQAVYASGSDRSTDSNGFPTGVMAQGLASGPGSKAYAFRGTALANPGANSAYGAHVSVASFAGFTGKTYGVYAAVAGPNPVGYVADMDSSTASPHVNLIESANDYARLQFQNNQTTSVFHVAARPQATAAQAQLNVWYTTGGDIARFMGDGSMWLRTLPMNGGSALCSSGTGASGFIGRCSSSQRYKKDVRDLELGADVVSRLRPVSFTSLGTGERDFGFIAEEVAKIDPMLATYDEKGRPESVRYQQMTAILANAVQSQADELRSIRKELDARARSVNELVALVDAQRRTLERQEKLLAGLVAKLSVEGR